jgi:GSCFA family
MELQTKVEIPNSPIKIGYNDKILSLGSCFAQNIGSKLVESCFDIDVNPFGVLYNPLSIWNAITILNNKVLFSDKDLNFNNGLWFSYLHSTHFSDCNQEKCLEKINLRLIHATEQLSKANFILITFGTAWIYELASTGEVVSNCHKLNASYFTRRRLSVDEITTSFAHLIDSLHKQHPGLQFILSVSPIRHFKDGAFENNLSKSTLLLSIDNLRSQFDFVHYFPAYEIQMDQLRDYRFYASDMIHPSEQAIQYIWEKFSATYFEEKTRALKHKVLALKRDINHLSINPNNEDFKKFRSNVNSKLEDLVSEFPFLKNRLEGGL